jgi:hypothetical protein
MIEIEISQGKFINVRESGENGNRRYVRSPGDDVSNDPPEVQAAAAELWTESIIEEYQSALAALLQPDDGPAQPTVEERLAAVEEATLALMLGGL